MKERDRVKILNALEEWEESLHKDRYRLIREERERQHQEEIVRNLKRGFIKVD